MLYNFVKAFSELKNYLIIVYANYKDAKHTPRFIMVYILSICLIISYFSFFFMVLPIVFIYTTLIGIVEIFFKHNSFKIRSLKIYEYNFSMSTMNILKYYLCDIVIQYAYLGFYIILKTIVKRDFIGFLKQLSARIVYFLFCIFLGFPIFFLKLINKLYIRINNSLRGRETTKLLLVNFESMFFFDFNSALKYETYNISWADGNLIFNPPKLITTVRQLYNRVNEISVMADYHSQSENLQNFVYVKDVVDHEPHRSGYLHYGADHNNEDLYVKCNLTSKIDIWYNKNFHLISSEKHELYNKKQLIGESYFTPFEVRKISLNELVKKSDYKFNKDEVRDLARAIFPQKIKDDLLLLPDLGQEGYVNKNNPKYLQWLYIKKDYSLLQNIINDAQEKGTIVFEPVIKSTEIANKLNEKLTVKQLEAVKWLHMANTLADLKKLPITRMKAHLKIIKYFDLEEIETQPELKTEFNEKCNEIDALIKFLNLV